MNSRWGRRRCVVEALEQRNLLTGVGEALLNSSGFYNSDGLHAQLGDQHFFAHFDLRYGQELWVSSGDDQPANLLRDLNPGEESSEILSPVTAGGSVYFTAQVPTEAGDLERRLFHTDGSPEGTKQVFDKAVSRRQLGVFRDHVLFYVPYSFSLSQPSEVWITDGTAEGTVKLLSIDEPLVELDGQAQFITSNDGFYFQSSLFRNRIFFSDGTPEGTRQLSADLPTSYTHEIHAAYRLGNEEVLFARRNAVAGDLLKVSADGSAISLTEQLSIDMGSLTRPVQVGEMLFFFDDDRELWQSDGTITGTVPIRMSGAVPEDLPIIWSELYEAGTRLVFRVSVDQIGSLATYDTVSGDITVYRKSAYVSGPHLLLGNQFYYFSEQRLLRLDLSNDQWDEIDNLQPYRYAEDLVGFGGGVVYSYEQISDEGRRSVLKFGDSTGQFRTFASLQRSDDDLMRIRVEDSGSTLIVTKSGFNAAEVFRSDSSGGELNRVASTKNPSHQAAAPVRRANHTVLDGRRYVFTDEGPASRDIWISDGTELGTYIAFSLNRLPDGTIANQEDAIRELFAFDGKLVFSVQAWGPRRSSSSRSLWSLSADGEAKQILDSEDSRGYLFDILGSVNGRLIFVTQETSGAFQQTVWRTTEDATGIEPILTGLGTASRIESLDAHDDLPHVAADGQLFFRVEEARRVWTTGGRETAGHVLEGEYLWRTSDKALLFATDGTIEGTQAAITPSDLCDLTTCRQGEVYTASELAWVQADSGAAQIPGSSQWRPLPEEIGAEFRPLGVLGDRWLATDGQRIIAWDFITDDVEVLHESDSTFDEAYSPILVGSRLYFLEYALQQTTTLWATDGTREGVVMIPIDFGGLGIDIQPSGKSDGQILVQQSGKVWLVDGKPETPRIEQLADTNAPFGFTQSAYVQGLHSDYLFWGVLFPKGIAEIQLDSPESDLDIGHDGLTAMITANGETIATWDQSQARVDLGTEANLLTIDVAALASNPSRSLILEVPDESSVRLIGASSSRVIISRQDYGILIQISGLRLELRAAGYIKLIDEMGISELEIRGTNLKDTLRLASQNGNPTIIFFDESRPAWSLELAGLDDGGERLVLIDLLGGADEVLVYDSLQISEGAEKVTMQIDQAVGGGDQTSISLPESYMARKTPNGLTYESLSKPSHEIRLSTENDRFRNPADRHDVNLDGHVSAIDALVVINALRRDSGDRSQWPGMPDVSGDGRVSALDALQVINRLARDHAIASLIGDFEEENKEARPFPDQARSNLF